MQIPVKSAVDDIASPDLDGVASVMSVIKPGKESHPVLAMASNRTYGLNLDAGETMQPQPFSLVGDGAGSTFKVFTVAAALEMGMGINAQLDVPAQFQAKGLGSSDTPGCPAATWCVKNAGGYRGSMNITDALATSPNTAFAKLISQIGVQRSVDMAVRLGLRSYALPGTARDYDPESNESLADFVKRQNIGSFTLGPIEVNALEFSNVAATLASGGIWCPPNPIAEVIDRDGKQVSVTTETCEQAVPEGLANTLANAMSKDDTGAGTAASAAGSAGLGPADVGQDRYHRGAPLIGVPRFHQPYAAANYIYDDSTTPGELCSFPLRRCGDGNLFGGNEPARTWFTAMKPIANNFGEVKLPPTDPRFVDGAPGSRVPSVSGMSQDTARQRLRDAGFQVADQATRSTAPRPTARWWERRRRARRFPARSSRFRSPTASRRHRRRHRRVRCRRHTGIARAGGPDGRPDPRLAADHRPRAGSAPSTTAAATAVIG